MNLDPIAIATEGYVCDLVPNDISIALHGYECITGSPPVVQVRRMWRMVWGVVWRDIGNWDEHI